MSPHPQDMDFLLEQATESGTAGNAAQPSDQMIPEFDAFFEKLSTLDDMVLTADPEPVAKRGDIVHKPIRLRPDKQHAGGTGGTQNTRKQKMQVLHSELMQDERGGVSGRGRTERQRRGGDAGIPHGFVTFLKLTTAALLLFGVGLGSGWLALSVPFNSEQGFERVQDSPSTGTAIVTGNGEEGDSAGLKIDAAAFSVKTGGAHDSPRSAQGAPAATGPGKPKSAAAAGISDNGKPTQAKPGAGSSHDKRYAIQVGACQSATCVQAYRKLLLSHVKSDAIQVVERSVGTGRGTVQRIRVLSSSVADANKLKTDLAQADARFKDAYVITLPKAPSS